MKSGKRKACSASLSYSIGLTEEAQHTFSENLHREVSSEETQSMLSDLTGFFALLHEWDLKDREQSQSSKGVFSNERIN